MTDLLETGEEVFTTDFSEYVAEKHVRRNPQGFELGVCRVCGSEASTPSGTYCADHKTRQSRDTRTAQDISPTDTVTGTQRVSRPVRTGRGAPSGDEWSSKVFDKVLILLSALIAGSMIRRYGLNDPNDAIADALTMEGDEARRIARPLGRFMAGTKFSKTRGRQVLENSDLLDAGFALYDYFDRVNKTLRQYQQQPQPLASVTPIHQTERVDDGETYTEVERQPGIPDGNGLPTDISGWNYVP